MVVVLSMFCNVLYAIPIHVGTWKIQLLFAHGFTSRRPREGEESTVRVVVGRLARNDVLCNDA